LDVYALAVSWITSAEPLWNLTQNHPKDKIQFNAPIKINPYYMPWIMAKLFSDQWILNHPIL
jgi:hypothetical protein